MVFRYDAAMTGTPSTVLDRFRLDGKVVVVTGGAGLYGTQIARAMAEAGAHTVLASRDESACQIAADLLAADGLSASAAALDLADEASIRALRERVVAEHGRIDTLVNNAVFRAGGPIDVASAADLRRTAEVNYVGLLLICREVGEQMRSQGSGSMINVSSIYGMVGPQFAIYEGTPMSNPAFYAFDKGGMINLTRYLAAYYGPFGVRVNCVSPGGLHTADQPNEFVAAYEHRTPLGRMAGDDDLKGPIVFLASDAAAYVTGVNLPVDGGWTAV